MYSITYLACNEEMHKLIENGACIKMYVDVHIDIVNVMGNWVFKQDQDKCLYSSDTIQCSTICKFVNKHQLLLTEYSKCKIK